MKHDARTQAAIDAGHPEWAELPASAREAKALDEAGWPEGLPRRLFTGRSCINGHVAPRQVSGYFCVECNKGHAKKYARRPDVRARANAKARKRYRKNPQTPEQKAAFAAYMKEYRKRPAVAERHRKRMLSVVAERRAATPDWLTDTQRAEIKAIYDQAIQLSEETGEKYHVDHIVPLTHPYVCGFHVPWNLQVLTADDNSRKHNQFDGTLDNEGWRV